MTFDQTAGHRKYGDPPEAYRCHTAAFDTNQYSRGDVPIEDVVLDD